MSTDASDGWKYFPADHTALRAVFERLKEAITAVQLPADSVLVGLCQPEVNNTANSALYARGVVVATNCPTDSGAFLVGEFVDVSVVDSRPLEIGSKRCLVVESRRVCWPIENWICLTRAKS